MEVEDEGNGNRSNEKLPEPDSTDRGKPIVFQCARCNTVLGDSQAWVCGSDEQKTITLKSVSTMTKIDAEIKSVTEGLYGGSTYQEVRCEGCEKPVGRFYLATTRNLDDLRNAYSLFVEKLNCYEVGATGEERTSHIESDELSCANGRYLLQEIRKIQGVALSLNNRLRDLEEYFMSGNGTETLHPDTPRHRSKTGK